MLLPPVPWSKYMPISEYVKRFGKNLFARKDESVCSLLPPRLRCQPMNQLRSFPLYCFLAVLRLLPNRLLRPPIPLLQRSASSPPRRSTESGSNPSPNTTPHAPKSWPTPSVRPTRAPIAPTGKPSSANTSSRSGTRTPNSASSSTGASTPFRRPKRVVPAQHVLSARGCLQKLPRPLCQRR